MHPGTAKADKAELTTPISFQLTGFSQQQAHQVRKSDQVGPSTEVLSITSRQTHGRCKLTAYKV
jgi:hypothetical protein